MKKMKWMALLLSLALVFGLTACSSSSGSSDTSDDASADSSTSSETESSSVADVSELISAGDTITIICPYGVGGTADLVARQWAYVAGELYSDYNWIVENVTGGDGFTAAIQYAEEDVDTTDLLVYGYGVAYRHDLGTTYGTETVEFDRDSFYPIVSVDDRTWILYAEAGTTLEDVLAEAAEGTLKMSGGNPLSDPHLSLGSLLAEYGYSVTAIAYDGGAAQVKALTDGEVDVFMGTASAGMEYVEAGTIVPLLAFSEEAFEGFVDSDGNAITVPSVAGDDKSDVLDADIDFSGSILAAGGTIATRNGASDAWIDFITEVGEAVWASSDFTDWLGEQLLNVNPMYGDDCVTYIDNACVKALSAYELLSGTTE